jgi:hypothetical protein
MSNPIILVSSCDRYRGCWGTFKYAYDKYWKDCPWEIVFITNNFESPFKTIKVGDTTSWSESMRLALKQVTASSVLLLLEDYWLCANPDTLSILEFMDTVETKKAHHIRLTPSDEAIESYSPKLKKMPYYAEYLTSLQPSIWNTDLLRKCVVPTPFYHYDSPYYYTSWAFESEGKFRIDTIDNIFLTVKKHDYFHLVGQLDPKYKWCENPVVSGMWTEAVHEYEKYEGISIDTKVHPRDL